MTYRMAAKILTFLIAITGISGCGSDITSSGTLSRITFDRSHGSLWGIQFYIDLTETEIAEARFFRQGETEQTEVSHRSISSEEWAQVEQIVSDLVPSLEEYKEKKSFFGSKMQKMDGGESRTLTLTRRTETGEKTITYRWPSSKEADSLEILLETLAQNTIKE